MKIPWIALLALVVGCASADRRSGTVSQNQADAIVVDCASTNRHAGAVLHDPTNTIVGIWLGPRDEISLRCRIFLPDGRFLYDGDRGTYTIDYSKNPIKLTTTDAGDDRQILRSISFPDPDTVVFGVDEDDARKQVMHRCKDEVTMDDVTLPSSAIRMASKHNPKHYFLSSCTYCGAGQSVVSNRLQWITNQSDRSIFPKDLVPSHQHNYTLNAKRDEEFFVDYSGGLAGDVLWLLYEMRENGTLGESVLSEWFKVAHTNDRSVREFIKRHQIKCPDWWIK